MKPCRITYKSLGGASLRTPPPSQKADLDIDALITKTDFDQNIFRSNFRFNSLLRGGEISDARKLFDQMPHKDTISTNMMISAYVKSGNLTDARVLFDTMYDRNVVTWTAMIAGYVQRGYPEEGLKLFNEMRKVDIKGDQVTFPSVLKASANLASLSLGKRLHSSVIGQQFHSLLVKTSYVRDVIVGNALLDFYSKIDCAGEVRKLFDDLMEVNGVSYNVVISCYAKDGNYKEALEIFRKLESSRFDRRQFPFPTLLSIAANMGNLEIGRQIHSQVVVMKPDTEIQVGTSLVDMYPKCGRIEEAKKVFVNLSNRNTVEWTAMISGNVMRGYAEEGLKLFNEMHKVDIKGNQATFASVLKASANLASLSFGKQLHSFVIRSGFMSNVFSGTALLDMYAKCGSIKDAIKTFYELPQRNIVSWNALILAYSQNGFGENTLKTFEEMVNLGFHPDSVSFVGVLSACSHCGLVDEGLRYFNSMTEKYEIFPEKEHYSCMVDLFCRKGRFDEAEKLMGQRGFNLDEVTWSSVLNSCKIHKNQDLAKKAADNLFKMEKLRGAAAYVSMSNIYADAGMLEDVREVRKAIRNRGVKKVPAYSWVEIKNKVHVFSSNDKSHPQMKEIRRKIEDLVGLMEQEGYKPDTRCALNYEEEEIKIESLKHHSERLAIAFALISTSVGSPILVMKNLRACNDCHASIKMISKITKREITVRDSRRFHHFKDGLCSCGDYW